MVLEVSREYVLLSKQHAKVNIIISFPEIIKMGVPQGRIMGPIIFITFINLLLKLNVDRDLVSYAYDTGVVKSGINQIMCWVLSFYFSLNIQETKNTTFAPINFNRPDYEKIYLNMNQSISSCNKIKNLAVIIDKHMKCGDHISFTVTKIRK